MEYATFFPLRKPLLRLSQPFLRFINKREILTTFLVIHCSLFIASCLQSPVYQAHEGIPKTAWAYTYKPAFEFDIADTAARYGAYFLMRHTDAYPFSNLWLWVETTAPGDSTPQRVRLEVPLAEKNGRWLGRGTGSIWEHRAPLTPNGTMRFPKAGRYTVSFEQAMRTNPLPEVLQVGLRVEKQ